MSTSAALRVAFLTIIGLLPLISYSDTFSGYDYELGPGDRIVITVFGEDELNTDAKIGDSGVINYPYIGELKISGLTLGKLKEKITNSLKGDYLVNPIVQVSILEYRPFFIDGEVSSPGGYPFQPGLTIMKAAALAKGFTERASKEKIFITREVSGKQEILKANLNTQLRPGDIVNVEQRFF